MTAPACRSCDGVGEWDGRYVSERCGRCNGMGMDPGPCVCCDGAGTHDDRERDCLACGNTGLEGGIPEPLQRPCERRTA